MTPHDLLAAFETLAEAPDGITRLRELVLQLAVRGKLVPQDPSDEPACVLLERIAAEKARLVKAEKIPKPKPLPQMDEDEVPFVVPEGWALVPFGEVFVNIFTGPFGTALKASEYIRGATPVINPQNMRDGVIMSTDDTCVGPETICRLSTLVVYERDVIVARRGEMGRCAVVSPHESGWLCGTGSLVLRPPKEIVPQYVALFLRSPSTVLRLAGDSVGSTMSNLNQRIMVDLPFGLPPLPEQRRIVAKIDVLMALLDRLEAAQEERETARTTFRDAALAALRDGPDAEAVEAAWTRIADRMDDMFTSPADLASLRQTILQLAIRGKLVPQDPNDEPTYILLERIASEKARLVQEGKIPESKPLPPVGEGEVPFTVPEGWVRCRLGELTDLISGQHLGPAEYHSEHTGLPYLTGPADFGPIHPVATRWTIERRAVAIAGDILLTVKGAGIGKTNVLDVPEAAISRQLMAIRPLLGMGSYLDLVVTDATSHFREKQQGIAIPGISRKDVLCYPLIIPPLPEQYRIVAKVDALTALCDALEARLAAAREAQAAFAAAAVHHLDV